MSYRVDYKSWRRYDNSRADVTGALKVTVKGDDTNVNRAHALTLAEGEIRKIRVAARAGAPANISMSIKAWA